MIFEKYFLGKLALSPAPCKMQACEHVYRHTKSKVLLPYKMNKA